MKGLRRFGAITGVLVRHGYGNVIERMFKRSRKKGAETTPEIRPAFRSPPHPAECWKNWVPVSSSWVS